MNHSEPDAYALHLSTGEVVVYTVVRECDGGYELERPQQPFGTERRWLPREMVERVAAVWTGEKR